MRKRFWSLLTVGATLLATATAGACDRQYSIGLGFAPMYYPYAPAAPLVSAAPPQQGLTDIISIIQVVGEIIGRLRPSGPAPGGDGDLGRVSDSLGRVERKLDRLEDLIENRLRRLEEDVETLQKSHRQTSAQLENRLVETAAVVHRTNQVFADKADAIIANLSRSQQQTAILLAQLKVPGARPVKLSSDVSVTAFPTAEMLTIPAATEVDVLGDVTDGELSLVIVRWTAGGKTLLATAQKQAVK